MTQRALPGSTTSAASTSTRTRSGPRISTIPTSCGSTSTRCPVCRGTQIRHVALVGSRGARGGRAGRLAQDVGLTRHPHQRPDRAALDVPGGPPGGAGPRPRRRAAGARARHHQVVEGGAPRRLPRLQPERQGPDGRLRVLGAPAARCAGLDAADLGRGADGRGRGLHDRHGPGAVRRDRRPGGRHRRRGRVARGAAGALGARRGGGPGRRSVAAELRASRPASRRASSRPARAGRSPSTSRGAARRVVRPPDVAAERAAAVAAGDPNAGCRPSGPARARPRPAGARRRSPWSRSRGPSSRTRRWPASSAGRRATRRSSPYLEPPDILVDGMRGRSTVWYRVRVNLIHVPEADRPVAGTARERLRPVGGPGHRGLEGGDGGFASEDAEAEVEAVEGGAAVSRCRRSRRAGTARSPRAGRSGRPRRACPGASA